MHRFHLILLTATAAILGMIPIAPTIYAIIGGLAVATVLTIVLPALYVIWFRLGWPWEQREMEATCPSIPLPS